MIDLSGRVALVTGAGGGLGREHALLLAARGAKVVVNDLDLAPAQSVADEINSAGSAAIAVAASVTDMTAIEAMVERTLSQWSRVDILINNASILRGKSFAKMDVTDFRLVVDVHLMGAVHCTKAVWNHMRAQNYGPCVPKTPSALIEGRNHLTLADHDCAGLLHLVGLDCPVQGEESA
jgi:NAD(P)-dependent dehydrogenase (short-subunit alcohol dehydrogenase family)